MIYINLFKIVVVVIGGVDVVDNPCYHACTVLIVYLWKLLGNTCLPVSDPWITYPHTHKEVVHITINRSFHR